MRKSLRPGCMAVIGCQGKDKYTRTCETRRKLTDGGKLISGPELSKHAVQDQKVTWVRLCRCFELDLSPETSFFVEVLALPQPWLLVLQ